MKNKTTSNIHYLPQNHSSDKIAPTTPIETQMESIADQLKRMEMELKEKLKRIESELRNARGDKSAKTAQLRGELSAVQSSFDHRLNELKQALPSAQISTSPEEEFDPFGRDPAFEKKLKPFFDFLYNRYWRVSTSGLENIPSKGRALLVGNHSGTLPYDGSMIRMAVTNEHPAERDVRFLVEDFVYYLPFVGTFMYRIGGVRASQENAERLLNSDHLVAVFPEGVKGIGKFYSQRYHLQRFGRGGFIKLAIRTQSPLVPVAVIGAEEIHPMLFKSSLLAKPLGIPYIPITPTFPLLGLLGLLPFPTKWSIHFGEPIDFSRYGKKALNNDLQIHKLSELVRQRIQTMVTEALKKRKSVLWG